MERKFVYNRRRHIIIVWWVIPCMATAIKFAFVSFSECVSVLRNQSGDSFFWVRVEKQDKRNSTFTLKSNQIFFSVGANNKTVHFMVGANFGVSVLRNRCGDIISENYFCFAFCLVSAEWMCVRIERTMRRYRFCSDQSKTNIILRFTSRHLNCECVCAVRTQKSKKRYHERTMNNFFFSFLAFELKYCAEWGWKWRADGFFVSRHKQRS